MRSEIKRPSPLARKIDKILFTVTRWVSYLVGVAILIIMLLAFLDVIANNFFNTMIPGATEWITYLNVLAVFPAVAYVQLDRGHTNVEFLNGYLPKIAQKGLRIVGHIIGAGVSGLVAWRAFALMVTKFVNHEMSSSSATAKGSFYVWPFVLVLALGCVLLAIAFLWCIVKEVNGMADEEREKAKAETEAEAEAEAAAVQEGRSDQA